MGATSFDIILEDYVGGFGRYQILNTLVINLVTYCAFYPILYYIFTAYQPPHRCRIPLCESENQTKVIHAEFKLAFIINHANTPNKYYFCYFTYE